MNIFSFFKKNKNNEKDYEKIILKILEFYDIGKFEKILKFYKKETDSGNLIISFKTNKGEYVFKKYLRKSAPEIINQIKMFQELIKINSKIKIPLILTKTNEGVVKLKNNFYSIDKLDKGENYFENFDKRRIVAIAKQLAEFHKKIPKEYEDENFIHRIKRIGQTKTIFEDTRKFGFSCKKQLEEIKNKTEFEINLLNKIIPFLFIEYKKLREDLDNVVEEIEKENRKKSMLHGDFQPLNFFFNSLEVSSIIDYESIYIGLHGYELIKSSSFLTSIKIKNEQVDIKDLKKFIESYKEVFGKLDIKEKEVMTFLRHSYLESLSYFIIRYLKIKDSKKEIKAKEKTIKLINTFFNKFEITIKNENIFVELFK